MMRKIMTTIMRPVMSGIFPSTAASDPIAVALKAVAVSAWSHTLSSGTVADLIGSNTLEQVGTVTNEAGVLGQATRSTGDWLATATSDPALCPDGTPFSVWLLIRINAAGFQGICGSGEGGDTIALRTGYSNNINITFGKAGAYGGTNTANDSMPEGEWIAFAFGHDPDNNQGWYSFNGAAKTTFAHTTGVGASGTPWRFHRGFNNSATDNSIDESIFTAHVMTNEQLSWLNNSGAFRSMSEIANA